MDKIRKEKMIVSYDDAYDILWVELKNGANSCPVEEDFEDFITFYDLDTDEITGYQVMNAKFRISTGEMAKYPWNFDYEKLLLPRLKRKKLL